jgi:AraC family ethanolamine operon transcriptional activator
MKAGQKSSRLRGHDRYRLIVERLEELATAETSAPSRISYLCKSISVSQRTVSRAFRVIRGTTPRSYLHSRRMEEVRKALLSADSESKTVTEIAMRFGFRELGRFAADYRDAFGEYPSATLRRRR